MSIFGSIMDKIFHHPTAQAGDAPAIPAAAPGSAAAAPAPAQVPPSTTSAQVPATAPATALASAVDVGAVLAAMASGKGGGGNYQTSIVDLLKLLDLDSSLDARKHLGQELDVHAGADGTAEQNIALHRAVIQKLAQNGGKIPAEMKG